MHTAAANRGRIAPRPARVAADIGQGTADLSAERETAGVDPGSQPRR